MAKFVYLESMYQKHEIVACEACGTLMECRANAYSKCACSAVELSVAEVQYISELFDACLCPACLRRLKQEYHIEHQPSL